MPNFPQVKPLRPPTYTKNYRNLSKAGSNQKKWPDLGRAYQMAVLCQIVSHGNVRI